jgi:ABC-type lipoprotein release transport system permease subunit
MLPDISHDRPVLAGTIVFALLITVVPVRRAVHLRPGRALRYA